MKYYKETYELGVSIWRYHKGQWTTRQIKIRNNDTDPFRDHHEDWKIYYTGNPMRSDPGRYTELTEAQALVELL